MFEQALREPVLRWFGVKRVGVFGADVVGDGVVAIRVDGASDKEAGFWRGLVLREPSMIGAVVLGNKVDGDRVIGPSIEGAGVAGVGIQGAIMLGVGVVGDKVGVAMVIGAGVEVESWEPRLLKLALREPVCRGLV